MAENTQSMEVVESVHESVIAQRCMQRLDNMKSFSKDERPKTKRALQNVLSKETSVIYVSSVLSLLYEYPDSVNFSEVDDIFKSETDLDNDIVKIVFQRCKDEGRTLHVLPSDSNLHSVITEQIKNWYAQKDELFNPQNPVEGIAKACCYDNQLSPDRIYDQLKGFGYVHEKSSRIFLQLPDEDCMTELKTGIEQWEKKIAEDLQDLTIKYYECFADIIIDVNSAIHRLTARKMGRYSEKKYFKRYPMFTEQGNPGVGGMINRLFVEDRAMETNGNNAKKGNEDMETSENVPTDSASTFPLKILPEVAYALVHLATTEPLPQTRLEAISYLNAICNITYIASPKYVLSSLAPDEKITQVSKNTFTMQLHLGRTVTKKQKDVNEITQLALLLSFPGKNKIMKKYNQKLDRLHSYYGVAHTSREHEVTVSMDDINSILRSFQQHIVRRSKHMAERYRATAVFSDRAAEFRCREKLHALLDEVNTNPEMILTEEEFSKKMEELSFEVAYVNSESVIEKLRQIGYLTLNNEEVVYEESHIPRGGQIHDNIEIGNFIERWKTDQRHRDNSKPREGHLSLTSEGSRKRTISMSSHGGKRARILEV